MRSWNLKALDYSEEHHNSFVSLRLVTFCQFTHKWDNIIKRAKADSEFGASLRERGRLSGEIQGITVGGVSFEVSPEIVKKPAFRFKNKENKYYVYRP